MTDYEPRRLSIIEQYAETVEKHGGEVCLVHLHCDHEVLIARVGAEARKQYGKVTTVALLDNVLDGLEDPFSPIVGRESLSIDTGSMQPSEAAEQIVMYYGFSDK